MLMYTGGNFIIPKTVHYLTSGPFLQLCDLINKKSFGMRMSKHLIWQKRGEQEGTIMNIPMKEL